jgi:glucan phosphoethanolaminetransferase (alkaline phosphatase superfamily)
MPLVALTIVAVWYIHSVFGLYVNFEIIASICETNWDEAAPYCTWPKIMSVCFVLIAITGGVWYGNKKLSRHLRWNDFIPAILVYMASTSVFYVDWYGMNEVTPEFLGYKQAPTWPVSDIVLNQRRIRKYKRTEGYSVTDMETLPSMADAGGSCSLPDDGEITVIVYVGESVRADLSVRQPRI